MLIIKNGFVSPEPASCQDCKGMRHNIKTYSIHAKLRQDHARQNTVTMLNNKFRASRLV